MKSNVWVLAVALAAVGEVSLAARRVDVKPKTYTLELTGAV